MASVSPFVAALSSTTTDAAPSVEAFLPSENPTGTGVIIFPGGGYRMHAEHEGRGYAEFLQHNGVAAFVVTYRLGLDGFRHPAMLEDALAALETVRKRAETFGIDPDKLGVMGSSAGGHLAAHASVGYKSYETQTSLRPSLTVLCYPVITLTGAFAHAGCRDQLLGASPTQALANEVSLERHVTSDTPPCFLWHTLEDASVPVENGLMFAQALRAKSCEFELHIYPRGRHGLGLDTAFAWEDNLLRWLKDVNEGEK